MKKITRKKVSVKPQILGFMKEWPQWKLDLYTHMWYIVSKLDLKKY